MIVKCAICGKSTDVLWPHLWQYKRAGKYMCSYGCMRAYDDKKGSNKDMPLTDNQRKTAIDMALRGESPLKYIANQGIKNPSCTWWNIKQYLSKNDPETYAKLPARIKGTKAEPKKPETPERVPAPIGGGKWEKIETPEGPAPTCCKPARPSGVTVPEKLPDDIETSCRVTALDTPIGEFHYDKHHEYIDWDWDNNTMSLNLEEWREFRKWFPIALKRLGVEL